MDNNNNPDGLNYRSFSKRESNTDYSRWSLLRQADKNSSFKVASGSEKASTPSGIFSSKTRNQENVLLDNEERFAPSSTHIEKISIQDMLSSKKILADKNETRSGLNSALRGNAVTTSKPNSALPKTGDGASSARGYSGSDTDGKGQVNTTAISSHSAEAILKSRSFDYAVPSSDRGSPAHASSIARTLKNNASPTSSYAHDNTFLRANMNSADLRYEEGRLRSAADQAFKNAATLEQLKNAEQSAQAVDTRFSPKSARDLHPCSRGSLSPCSRTGRLNGITRMTMSVRHLKIRPSIPKIRSHRDPNTTKTPWPCLAERALRDFLMSRRAIPAANVARALRIFTEG